MKKLDDALMHEVLEELEGIAKKVNTKDDEEIFREIFLYSMIKYTTPHLFTEEMERMLGLLKNILKG